METQEFLTQEKKEELEKELEHLKTTVRAEILERLAFAKSLGDLSENAEYHSSKDAQGKNEARISQIEAILKNAVVVEANTDGTIGLGSTVILLKKETGEEKTYQIVGNEEADFSSGKISFESPIGAAVMNKSKGDEVSVETPKGVTHYQINSVQ
ncbi:MAG: transcription elongation factor GreA [Candidatus Pacebacteria bacterium]|nr:transcription elongation factor GreA [Candidatus Paceibacterota bacterium]